MGADRFRFEYDPLVAIGNAPKLMGMELHRHGRGLEGAYYLNGDRHVSRKDKLKVFVSKGSVWVKEEGGRCVSLPQWLVEFGGAADYKEAIGRIKGEPVNMEWRREYRESAVKEVKYVDPAALRGAKEYDLALSPLFRWMCGLFSEEKVREVWNRYNVTANSRGGTVFWYVDGKGRICHDKVAWYGEDGHRIKTMSMGREYRVGDGYSARAFFGEHLMPPSGEICCLESEKSALLASLAYPDKCWVACGGKSNLRGISARFRLYPDLDAVEDWRKSGARIAEWWKDWRLTEDERPENADLGDKIVWDVVSGM